MERVKVSSSNLESIGFDQHTNTMEIEFSRTKKGPGSVYQYHNVPAEVWHGLLRSPSKGGYFHKEIRQKFASTKIQ